MKKIETEIGTKVYFFYFSYDEMDVKDESGKMRRRDINKEGIKVSSIFFDEIKKERKYYHDKYVNGEVKVITGYFHEFI